MAKDYYNILGVSKFASPDEIKKAFRKLAHEHHPDKKTGDNDKFKEINEAYQVLGNQEKRQQYDQFGQTFKGAGSNNGGPGGFGGRAGGNPFGGFDFGNFSSQGGASFGGDFGDLGDLFGGMFGGGGGVRSNRGSDLETELAIEFEESVFGVEKIIDLNKQVICDKCQGNGAEPNSKINTCKTCGGAGRVNRVQQTILGNFQTQTVCSDCQGEGKKAEQPCFKCRGQGHIRGEEKIKVQIPAGIESGQSIKLSGKGEAGKKGQAGDLYLRVKVRPSKKFVRVGDNIKSTAQISVKQALLGDKIMVETVDGPVNLRIPEGTESKTEFKLNGKGVPHLRFSGRGDHLVEVIVKMPRSLNRSQKKIIEQLDF